MCGLNWKSITIKPVFHGACFGAVSAPTLYAPYGAYLFVYLNSVSVKLILGFQLGPTINPLKTCHAYEINPFVSTLS